MANHREENYLIVGATGNVGSEVVARLLKLDTSRDCLHATRRRRLNGAIALRWRLATSRIRIRSRALSTASMPCT